MVLREKNVTAACTRTSWYTSFFIALLYDKSVIDSACSVMLDACIGIVRTYIMIIQMYVTPASVTGWKADARKTSCQYRGWSSAKAKQLSRGTSFFPLDSSWNILRKINFALYTCSVTVNILQVSWDVTFRQI